MRHARYAAHPATSKNHCDTPIMAEPNHGVDGDEDNTAEEKADDDGDDILDPEEFEDLASPHLFVFSRGDKNVFVVAEKVGLEDDNHGDRSLVLAEITSLLNSGFVTGIRDPWRTESRRDILPQRKRQRQGQRRTQRITVYRGPSFYITEEATHDGYYMSKRSVEYRGKESKQNIIGKVRVGQYIFVEDVHYNYSADGCMSKTNRVFIILGSVLFVRNRGFTADDLDICFKAGDFETDIDEKAIQEEHPNRPEDGVRDVVIKNYGCSSCRTYSPPVTLICWYVSAVD
jgi:hypothetical protein